MNWIEKQTIRIAILDLYEGVPNQGMRCIRDIIYQWGEANQFNVVYQEFEVRLKLEVPDTSFDVYISSGGPGSPLDTADTEWEKNISAGCKAWSSGTTIMTVSPKNISFLFATVFSWPAGIMASELFVNESQLRSACSQFT